MKTCFWSKKEWNQFEIKTNDVCSSSFTVCEDSIFIQSAHSLPSLYPNEGKHFRHSKQTNCVDTIGERISSNDWEPLEVGEEGDIHDVSVCMVVQNVKWRLAIVSHWFTWWRKTAMFSVRINKQIGQTTKTTKRPGNAENPEDGEKLPAFPRRIVWSRGGHGWTEKRKAAKTVRGVGIGMRTVREEAIED